MKKLSERVFVVSVSIIFGAVIAALAICIVLRAANFGHLIQRWETSGELPPVQPTPLYVQPGCQNRQGRMEERVDRGDIGMMMLDTETGKRRILWTSGDLHRWSAHEFPQFIVVLGKKPSDIKPEFVITVICKDSLDRKYPIYVFGKNAPNFKLDEWKDTLAKDCNCATLSIKPSE